MKNALFLAWRSLWWHRGRSLLVILCLAMTIWLPLTVHLVLRQVRTDLIARADATPLVVGGRGSQVDLVLHALYFDTPAPAEITMAAAAYLQTLDLGTAIPMHVRYRTQSVRGRDGVRIVGTLPEYFEFRRLTVASGSPMTMLGECVVGAAAAETLRVQPGDFILSAPRNAFDLAGDYPLRMSVRGVLSRSHTPDDDVVFVDVKTAWVIDGIGHGHMELSRDSAELLPDSDRDRSLTASAAVLPYTEVTEDNIDSFHFHGDPETFPISAVLVVPRDEKSRVRLLGAFSPAAVANDASDQPRMLQILKPPEVIAGLLDIVFRIENLVRALSASAACATAILAGLVLMLSMKLRAAEMRTFFQMGCSRFMIAQLQLGELILIVCAATVIAGLASRVSALFAGAILRLLMF